MITLMTPIAVGSSDSAALPPWQRPATHQHGRPPARAATPWCEPKTNPGYSIAVVDRSLGPGGGAVISHANGTSSYLYNMNVRISPLHASEPASLTRSRWDWHCVLDLTRASTIHHPPPTIHNPPSTIKFQRNGWLTHSPFLRSPSPPRRPATFPGRRVVAPTASSSASATLPSTGRRGSRWCGGPATALPPRLLNMWTGPKWLCGALSSTTPTHPERAEPRMHRVRTTHASCSAPRTRPTT